MIAERCASDKVRMEAQCPPARLKCLSVVLYSDDLTGREAYDSAFLIVVVLPSVDDVSAFGFFQKYDVEAECVTLMLYFLCLCQIDDTDQRMQCF